MVRWHAARKDVLDALAEEILQNYSKGRVLVAIDGDDPAGSASIADDLATAVSSHGFAASRATEPADDSTIRSFPAEPGEGMLIVDGRELLRPNHIGRWNFSVWVEGAGDADADESEYVRQVGPRAKATAIVENRDPLHPRRLFADSC